GVHAGHDREEGDQVADEEGCGGSPADRVGSVCRHRSVSSGAHAVSLSAGPLPVASSSACRGVAGWASAGGVAWGLWTGAVTTRSLVVARTVSTDWWQKAVAVASAGGLWSGCRAVMARRVWCSHGGRSSGTVGACWSRARAVSTMVPG